MTQYQGMDIEMEIAKTKDEIEQLYGRGAIYTAPDQYQRSLKLDRAKEKLRQLELQKAREKEVKDE